MMTGLTYQGPPPVVLRLTSDTYHPTFRQPVDQSHRWLLSRLGYRSDTLTGISCHLMDRLQSLLDAAVRLFNGRKYDSISPLLRSLQWLRVPEPRI